MSVTHAVDLCRDAVLLSLIIGGPVMLVATLVGLIVSLFQAVTQLQDQTISFVPKIVAMSLTLLYLVPWCIQRMVDYSVDLFQNIGSGL